jgi:hypothetical protein
LKCNHSALIVIGERDNHYITSKIETLGCNNYIKIEKVPNANHSLDIEPFNTTMSITVLEKVMERLKSFLKL